MAGRWEGVHRKGEREGSEEGGGGGGAATDGGDSSEQGHAVGVHATFSEAALKRCLAALPGTNNDMTGQNTATAGLQTVHLQLHGLTVRQEKRHGHIRWQYLGYTRTPRAR